MDSTQRTELDRKIEVSCALFTKAASEYRPVAYANSLVAEAMVLTNLIRILGLEVSMFRIDTGRLAAETYALMHSLRKVGTMKLRVAYPDGEKVTDLVSKWGVNGFYESIGCDPCTRATQVGELSRAGRWWWEHESARECGLHPRMKPKSGGGDGQLARV